jgi:arylsulfatase
LDGVGARNAPAANLPLRGSRPNILLIITDDQGYGDLSLHGNPVLRTPNMDCLGREGVRFEDCQVSPTCSPTRAALMTSAHEFRNGVTHTILERERLSLRATTLAQVLKGAGYATGIFGKWHLGDEAAYQPERRGFDEVFIHGGGGIGQTFPGSCGDVPSNRYFDPVIRHNGRFVRTRGFCTDVFFAEAARWIASQAKKGPWFAYLAPNAPHAPYVAPENYRQRFVGRVPAGTEGFFGMIENLDDNLGRLRKYLQHLGLDRDTLIIFMTDNGSAAGSKVFNAGMRGAKGTPWNGGTRVPLFIAWPGRISTGVCRRLVAHLDLLPTLAELAGADVSAEVRLRWEGRSLVPLLENPEADWPERFLFTHVGRWPRGADPDQYKYVNCAVRWGRYHMVSVPGRSKSGATPNWELFDLDKDPAEQTNLAAEHPDIVQTLARAYDAWWDSIRGCLENEQAKPPPQNPFKVWFWEQFGPGATAAPDCPLPEAARWMPPEGW